MAPSMGKQRSGSLTTRERLQQRWVEEHQGEVVLHRDLRSLGSASQVSAA